MEGVYIDADEVIVVGTKSLADYLALITLDAPIARVWAARTGVTKQGAKSRLKALVGTADKPAAGWNPKQYIAEVYRVGYYATDEAGKATGERIQAKTDDGEDAFGIRFTWTPEHAKTVREAAEAKAKADAEAAKAADAQKATAQK